VHSATAASGYKSADMQAATWLSPANAETDGSRSVAAICSS